MKKILICLFATAAWGIQAQTKKELIGKWTFTQVLHMDSLTAEQLQKMDSYVSSNRYLEFREDGTLISFPEKSNQTMTWKFDDKTKQITIQRPKNRLPIEIVSFRSKVLHVRMGIDDNTSGEYELRKK